MGNDFEIESASERKRNAAGIGKVSLQSRVTVRLGAKKTPRVFLEFAACVFSRITHIRSYPSFPHDHNRRTRHYT